MPESALTDKQPTGEWPAVRSRRILIVDDNPEVVESLSVLLGMAGNTTHSARDGEEAIGLAEQVRPEVVLLDLGLPKVDGFEVCRRMRQQPWGKDLVVVALTGMGHEDARTKTREAGFDMHLVKPVDPETLFVVLAAAG